MLANYSVGVGRPQAAPKTVAVFVAHGMGQQIPFETLDSVAQGLLREEQAERKRSNNLTPIPTPVSRTIKSNEQWFSRIELQLKIDILADRVSHQPFELHQHPIEIERFRPQDIPSREHQ